MALPTTRIEIRMTLSHVDRGLDVARPVIVGQHPSETREHVVLRLLAWCLLYDERLDFGPGLSDPEAADLLAHDLTGQTLTQWIECGTANADKLKKILQHNAEVAVHAVFVDARRRDELLAGIAAWKSKPRGRAALTVWTIDHALVAALAAREERRQAWTVTIVEGHIYVDADGDAIDGEVISTTPLAPAA